MREVQHPAAPRARKSISRLARIRGALFHAISLGALSSTPSRFYTTLFAPASHRGEPMQKQNKFRHYAMIVSRGLVLAFLPICAMVAAALYGMIAFGWKLQ